MMDKEDSALRTIGEVAEELNLPAHVLRFWETKFPQLKPNKRRGRHRYYRPEDIEKLKQIRHLLYEQGYTIKGAQKYLRLERKTDGQLPQVDLFAYSPPAEPSAPLKRLYNAEAPAPAVQPSAPAPAAPKPVSVAPAPAPKPIAPAPAANKGALGQQEVTRLKQMLEEINHFKQLLRDDA